MVADISWMTIDLHAIAMYLLIRNRFLLSLILCIYFAYAFNRDSAAKMNPDNPLFGEGETIVLNCTFTDHFNGTKNSSFLAFKHKGIVYGQGYVHPLTPRTAQLRIPNATMDHYGHFVCFMLPNQQLGFAAKQDVNIIRRPLKPNITECRVFNWESLICSWVPTSEEQNSHSLRKLLHTAAVWSDAGSEFEVCRCYVSEDQFTLTRDAKANFSSCGFQMGRNYTLQIEVSNRISFNVTSDFVYIRTSDIVWPNPPGNVTYSFRKNGTNGITVLLFWSPPTSKFRYDQTQLTYAVTFTSEMDPATKSLELLTNETYLTAPCRPYTYYTVTLKVRPLPLGYWSNETSLKLLTPSTVPCQQPNLNTRGFVLTTLTGLERMVMHYWTPVPKNQHCGPEFHYVVSVKSSGNWSILNTAIVDSSTEIQIGPNETHIRILAKNKEGISPEQQDVVRIPSAADLSTVSPVEEVIVEIDSGNLSYALVHWDYSVDSTDVTGVVAFWCSSSTRFPDIVKCKNNIEWKELNRTQQEFSVLLDSDAKLFRFGISVDFTGISFGIKWSAEVYSLDKVAPPPEKLDAVIPYGADHGHIYVSWKRPECRDSLCGHVNKYILWYCTVAKSGGCVGNYSISIGSTQFAYNLTNLNYGSKYRLWMLSSSRAGLSKPSTVVNIETAKPWKTTGAIIGIVIGALITAVVVICGLYGIYRYCRKYKKKITSGVEIVLPRSVPVSKVAKTSSSSETQILYNCYPSGYSRQGSDMSTLSRDSGRFSLTNPCTTSNALVLQQMSPLMSRPNGTLISSTMTPLIGIKEDGDVFDVFPEVPELDGNNYLKATVIEDPDDYSGYKTIRTVDSYKANDNLANAGQKVSDVRAMRQPEVWVCSSSPNCTSLPGNSLSSQMPVLLRTAAPEADNYIRIAPGATVGDPDTFYKSPQTIPDPAVSLPPHPPPGTADISYTTVEMLEPSLSIPASASPGGGFGGNAMENGYTDLTFLTNIILGNGIQGDDAEERLSQHEGNFNHQINQESFPSEGVVNHDMPQTLSNPLNSEATFANARLNGNNNSDFKSLINPTKNCLKVTSDQDYAIFRNSVNSHSVPSSAESYFSPPAKELDKENHTTDAIPNSIHAQCDNGYILHTNLIGNMVDM